ncbi:hypothetical protein CIG75_11265 [Tumebacillus algifaecis]|uniref:Pvc16 N-terminal domain-containing protein n=1 Tax=Tumebacillus algifaecis TaxID=1214604 RepID=A0A223D1P0_9BACL|nr:DUF4255 domain-containing protein [Tumebacillus algifaecis]ASS75502.1 hypothetical protein CIG75_11265 [Tumebacillus algifaecis]
MADFTVVADVGRTLVQLLRTNMTPDPIPQPEMIGLASPADKGDFVLSLFLYQIEQNGMAQQSYLIDNGSSVKDPPMAVDLHYLLTAHSNADLQTRSIDEQRIMGRALQVLNDNSWVKGSVLQGALADANEEFKVVMREPINLHTAITLFPNQPYKLSFNLVAGPIFIDSGKDKPVGRIVERGDTFGEA